MLIYSFMSEVFLNSQDFLDDLYQSFTNDLDDSALTHFSLTAIHIHEKFSQSIITISNEYFRVMIDNTEYHKQLKEFII